MTTTTQIHITLTGRHDDLAWVDDADTQGGLVSSQALDGGEARAIAETLKDAGYIVSTALDSDNRALRWIYIVPPAATTAKKSSGWKYAVTDGTRARPAGYIGTFATREEAEAAKAGKCRMGGYITRESSK